LISTLGIAAFFMFIHYQYISLLQEINWNDYLVNRDAAKILLENETYWVNQI